MTEYHPHSSEVAIRISNLTMAYANYVVMRELDFAIRKGEIFVIMGGSGSGKSTLLKHMIGLKSPAEGQVLYNGESFWDMEEEGEKCRQKAHWYSVPKWSALEWTYAG